eukprot:1347939-Amorphochlora_amoeboformis.AAC.2
MRRKDDGNDSIDGSPNHRLDRADGDAHAHIPTANNHANRRDANAGKGAPFLVTFSKGQTVDVGVIPEQKYNVKTLLTSSEDVDVQLFVLDSMGD